MTVAADPCIRLAHLPSNEWKVRSLLGLEAKAALLVSYALMGENFNATTELCRDWALDSGAYTAHTTGKAIDIGEYTEFAARRLEEDPLLTDVFGLDVIGDEEATRANVEKMWANGVPAIPTFHFGGPEEVLVGYARDYPKIALGGMAKLRGNVKQRFIERAFEVTWPARIHGFGFANKKLLMAAPFHSVDASTWSLNTCAFGSWQRFGRMSVYGAQNHDLRTEIEEYLSREDLARVRWRAQMAELESRPIDDGSRRRQLLDGRNSKAKSCSARGARQPKSKARGARARRPS